MYGPVANQILYFDRVERKEAIISALFDNFEQGGGDCPAKMPEQM
jgi:hypothetical protein